MHVRRRGKHEDPFIRTGLLTDELEHDPAIGLMHTYGQFFFLVFLWTLLYGIILLSDLNMPRALSINDEIPNSPQFIAERAKAHVTHLSSLGPRPVGSLANEVLAPKYIIKTLTLLQSHALPQYKLQLDLQNVSGEFPLQFLDGMTSVYRNIQNVVVKLETKSSSRSAILLNCHYDSVVESPGASDDLAGCAVLLEVLRVISLTNLTLKNDLVFLFNGAEENLLQGSHGFITQHKWAKNLLAVVNMDACGAGGRELLFQVGPENPWLLEAYARAVKFPTASIAAQEIFQSGLIPGDTDYRIFRDFGHIPGLDFAWAMNGYMYHTKLDNAEHVPLDSLQHAGENILPLTIYLANASCPEECEPNGTMVFFDILHLYVFRVPSNIAVLLAVPILLVSFYVIYSNGSRIPFIGLNQRRYIFRVGEASFYLLLIWLISILLNIGLAVAINLFSRTLSWFTRPAWIYFLYGVPALIVPLQCILISLDHFKSALKTNSNWVVFSLFVDASQCALSIFVLLGILVKVRTVFLLACMIACYIFSNVLKNYFFNKRMGQKWLWLYLAPMMSPVLFIWYIQHVLFNIIIPMMGRTGSGMLPEIVIAVLTSCVVIGIFFPLVPTIVMFHNSKKIIKTMGIIFICSLLVLIFTPLSFPYSSSTQNPSPQRYTILHTHREYRGINNVLLSERSGFWIVDLDPNSPHSVKSFVREFEDAVPVDDCPHQLYCGLPYKLPIANLLSKTHWIPSSKPNIHLPARLVHLGNEPADGNSVTISMHAEGPDHMSIMVSPIEGVTLQSWSFANGSFVPGSKWGNRETYFVYYSYASNPGPLKFWIKLKIHDQSVAQSPYLMDIAVSGHFLHGPHQKSVRLTKLLAQFPPWTVTSGWIATYTSYKF